jgi:hypothetical protein
MWRLIFTYVLWVTLLPVILLFAAGGLLCLYECTVAPWSALIVVPVLCLLIIPFVARNILVRARNLEPKEQRSVRIMVWTTVLWALPAIQIVSGVIGAMVGIPIALFGLFT